MLSVESSKPSTLALRLRIVNREVKCTSDVWPLPQPMEHNFLCISKRLWWCR